MAEHLAAQLSVHRAADRFVTRTAWLESWHSFSFGPHYDPANTGFGALVVSNDDEVAPGAGFDEHSHRDMEIVTWVVSGALAHSDSAGSSGVVRAGEVQRMSAGSGVRHSEHNASADEPVRFVQMWVLPETLGGEPSYEQAGVDVSERLTPVASGLPAHDGSGAVRLGRRAALHAARAGAGTTVELPSAPLVHLFVVRGAVHVPGVGPLEDGDALRITGAAGPGLVVTASTDAELLGWELHP